MRLFSSLLLALLPMVTLAAKKAPADRYADFSAKSYPITMNDNSFKKLVTIPRDYSSVVLLTALEARFGCQLCRDFQPEWDLVAKSWKNGDKKGETKLIYGTLDFMDGKDTFQAVSWPATLIVLSLEVSNSYIAGLTNCSYPSLLRTYHRSARCC